jgi:hypothetical protein
MTNYTIVSHDLDRIASNPMHYILYLLFHHYSSYKKKPDETAGILAWLYYIAKSGSNSIGSLYHLCRKYYESKIRSLPDQVYDYLSKLFSGKRPNEWPPPLFEIDRYGSIISFHGSVDRTSVRLIENPLSSLDSSCATLLYEQVQSNNTQQRPFV